MGHDLLESRHVILALRIATMFHGEYPFPTRSTHWWRPVRAAIQVAVSSEWSATALRALMANRRDGGELIRGIASLESD